MLKTYQEEAVKNIRNSMQVKTVIEKRDYQENILEQVYAFFRKIGNKSVVVVSPTGSGKTIMFAKLAKRAASRNSRVYILVHRREILEQTLKKMFELGVTSGQIASGRPQTIDSVQVAMVMSLTRRISYMKRPDLIIIDEVHHVENQNSWGRILKYWKDVPRIGFTATLYADRDYTGSFQELIQGPQISELVNDGYLSYPVIYKPDIEILQNYHVKRGDFDIKEQEEAMSKRIVIGSAIENYRQHFDGAPVLTSCVSIKHVHYVADLFNSAGYGWKFVPVWGDMPRLDRENAIGGMRTGSVNGVVFCDLINEGVDIPICAGVIGLRRTKSMALFLQISGRALRIYPGKIQAILLDHVGNYKIHGHILDDRQWSLQNQTQEPGEARPPTTTTCPICHGIWPGIPSACFRCGHRFRDGRKERELPQEVVGELIRAIPGIEAREAQDMESFLERANRMTPDQRQKAMWGKAFEMAGDGAPDARRRLDALRQAMGYRPNWTSFVWKEILKRRA